MPWPTPTWAHPRGATLGFGVLTGHPEKQIDFATRSTNLMTVRSKQIIEAFYRELPRFSYFLGCSGGGGQAVHEALQFPGDYDGIIAGAPLINQTHRSRLLRDGRPERTQ